MNSPEEKPSIELGYRPPLDEPTGPSSSQVLGAAASSGLCLVCLALALVFSSIAVAIFQGATLLDRRSDISLPSSSIGPAVVAAFCFFATVLLFQTSRRLFMGIKAASRHLSSSDEMVYQKVDEISQSDVAAVIERDQPDELLRIPIAVSLHSLDFDWAKSICVRLSSHPHFNVRGNAVLGFGHLARRFGRLNEAVVKPIIEAGLVDADEYVRGQANAAADDVSHFLGWTLKGYRVE